VSWVEGLTEREQAAMEDIATRVFTSSATRPILHQAAE
jgi:biopolymer transport protein ExbB